MDKVNARLDKVMCILANKHAQRLGSEKRLCQAVASQKAAAPPNPQAQTSTNPASAAAPNPVLFLPNQKPSTEPVACLLKTFKVAFAISFLTNSAATWAQPYTTKLFSRKPVVFLEFLNNFKASFFGLKPKDQAKDSLRSIRQTILVAAYTQAFNMHARHLGWSKPTLMSMFQQGLKEKVQLAVVMSNVDFATLPAMQKMALQAGNTMKAIRSGQPNLIPSISTPAPDPNAMDFPAFQDNSGNRPGQLSNAEREHQTQLDLCFQYGQEGHVSRGCRHGRKRTAGNQPALSAASISEVQAEINPACINTPETPTPPACQKMRELRSNAIDPWLFLTLPISISRTPQATFHSSFLIDLGATHNVLSGSYARRMGVLQYATLVSRFNGSTRSASFTLSVKLPNDPNASPMIVTTLKDSYDGILGIPWLHRKRHLIDWTNHCFFPSVAAVCTAFLSPPCLTSDWKGGSDQCTCQLVGQPRPISSQLPGWLATGQTALIGQACPTGWQDYWLDPPV
ncbi:hypothetical protein PCANC_24205 [Puccinia coronata f. sp. avenae]|uniref:Retrotransposon gag domain-containing protein n=1 Tax=Puccinia coronata f. sp. avenae TaxID=200324 RepID=A0A2N5SCI2_9BASI|nr:hypothetical protein PCANC_24205 [Puccinia coronata f. sp. avenae]